jgi:hypothetical protein
MDGLDTAIAAVNGRLSTVELHLKHTKDELVQLEKLKFSQKKQSLAGSAVYTAYENVMNLGNIENDPPTNQAGALACVPEGSSDDDNDDTEPLDSAAQVASSSMQPKPLPKPNKASSKSISHSLGEAKARSRSLLKKGMQKSQVRESMKKTSSESKASTHTTIRTSSRTASHTEEGVSTTAFNAVTGSPMRAERVSQLQELRSQKDKLAALLLSRKG